MKSLTQYIKESVKSDYEIWDDFTKDCRQDIENLGKDAEELEYSDIEEYIDVPQDKLVYNDKPIAIGFRKAEICDLRNTDWTVTIGYIGRNESQIANNNIWIEILEPKNKNAYKGLKNQNIYRVHGAGMYKSNENYLGSDLSKFQETIKAILKNHLHIEV